MTSPAHPQDVLFDAHDAAVLLPVCDHYCGTPERMRKALALQAEAGPVFDVTLDGEDGAPAGGEVAHAELMAALIASPANRFGRVGARVVDAEHAAFEPMLHALFAGLVAQGAGKRLAYLTLPKVGDGAHLAATIARADAVARQHGMPLPPLHALVETHAAVHDVWRLAEHPRIECLSFGLMDFVSAHRGAIGPEALTVQGQFEHPLVMRAKLALSAACHAHGKVASHCVVTEFKDTHALSQAARRAGGQLGYSRMWSIHPDQILPIVEALSPSLAATDEAAQVLLAAQVGDWAPIRHAQGSGGTRLHDRASFRLYWHLLRRAHAAGALDSATATPAMQQALKRFF